MIWSRALWDIRNAIGATQADTVILDAHFGFTPDISFRAAAGADDRHRAAGTEPSAEAGGAVRRSPRAGSRSRARARCSGKDGRPRGRRPAGPWPSALPSLPASGLERRSRRRRDERADARLPRLPRVRARPLAQHAGGLPQRPAAVRPAPARDRRERARRGPHRPGRASSRQPRGRHRHAAAGAARDPAAQGGLPALVLPPPAPRGRAGPRPDRRPARAAQEPAACPRSSAATRSRGC